MISLLLGLIIGLLVGAGFVYWALRRKLREQQHELKQTKRTIANLTRAHELQLQDTVESLKRDYRSQLDNEAASLAQQYAAKQQGRQAPPEPAAPSPQPASSTASSAAPDGADPTAPDTARSSAPPLAPIADPWGEAVAEPMPQPEPVAQPSAPTPVSADLAPVAEPEGRLPDPVSEASAAALPPQTQLHAAIAAWGKSSGALSQLLGYCNAQDATLRQQVAIALGQRYKGQTLRPGDQSVIATLSTLCRDGNPGVRQAAVEALGTVKSAAVIPVLQRALRDTDAGVVKAASLAIAQFKRYPMPLTKPTRSKPTKR